MASYKDSATRTEIRSSIISANIGTDVDHMSNGIFGGTGDGFRSFYSKGYNLIGNGNATG